MRSVHVSTVKVRYSSSALGCRDAEAGSSAARSRVLVVLAGVIVQNGLFGSKDGFGFCGRGVTRLRQAGSGAGNDQSL
jgi:hypothetical protein